MQYVRSLSGSVSKTWNSINPATLSGAIDVIVVEQDNGDLACSPFHVRFGKFSLLRPYEKKVEFRVNGERADYSMKLGEGGEAFFVFETSGVIPADLQTSPLVSPASSPRSEPSVPDPTSLQEPDYLDIDDPSSTFKKDIPQRRTQSDFGKALPLAPSLEVTRPVSGDWSGASLNLERTRSDEVLTTSKTSGRRYTTSGESAPVRPRSPPPLAHAAAVERAMALSRKLSISNIQTHVTNKGDVMLDMHGYKLDQEETTQAETLARKILAEEIDGDYDLGSLIGADRNGNLWIYSSEEAKELAGRQEGIIDLVSDAGYSSDEAKSDFSEEKRGMRLSSTPPSTPPSSPLPEDRSETAKSYAKTLRLTSDQLKSLDLKMGANEISFSVNRATCTAYMYLWRYDVPIVVSDVDGTITKSDALGHVFTMIGRDWTHLGVAKLYTDICSNGYNLMYLTSRSVGQADTTRNYLNGIVQDAHKLPKGPVIMSPDRTFHALRREVYLRKPEVFKMACLRDILNLFGTNHNPFYAGFGNRLTDALSYRSVNIPSTRIFTINSNAEVSLDLLCLTKYKSSYVNMRDLVDHFFPPVEQVIGIEEEFTDFNFWREAVVDPEDFTDEENDDDEEDDEDDENDGEMGESYLEEGEELEDDDEEDDDEEYEEGEEDDDYESHMADSIYQEAEPEQQVSDKEQERFKDGQEENLGWTRKPIMKNDLDRTPLDSVKDFAEQELGSIAEEVVNDIGKLTGWRKKGTDGERELATEGANSNKGKP
ncbi:Lipin/Ned1/Smp2-domain-containing protein [Geopyxis carbonaria]|nr:Lipin/Ned1/Smp2-domain-containing protein [Geopyxis carbonaria]